MVHTIFAKDINDEHDLHDAEIVKVSIGPTHVNVKALKDGRPVRRRYRLDQKVKVVHESERPVDRNSIEWQADELCLVAFNARDKPGRWYGSGAVAAVLRHLAGMPNLTPEKLRAMADRADQD